MSLSTRTPIAAGNARRTTPREVARILFRHRWKMAAFFTVVVASTVLFIALHPRSYSSEAKLFFRVGRESVALDPTATTGQTIMLQKSQIDEVNSARDILGSYEVYRRVVEQIGAERILKDSPLSSAGGAASFEPNRFVRQIHAVKAMVSALGESVLSALHLSDPASDVDLAIRQLQSGMEIWAPKQSTIVTLTYHAASPQLAHDVVDTTINVFLEEHLRMNQREGSLQFFTEQVDTLHSQLDTAQTELRNRKNEFQVASINSRRTIFEEQIQNVELELLRAQRELAFSRAKILDLTRAISEMEPQVVTNRVAGYANEAKDGMRGKLYDLELQESELQSKFKENHPQLVQIQRQRKQAQAILADLPDDRTQTTAGLNSNQRKLELELMEATAGVEALQAMEKAAQAQHTQLYEELRSLNDQEVQLAKLERDVQLLEGKYRMHVEKLEEARVNDAMGREQITNVKVAQPPTLTSKAESPNKRLLMAMGLIVAIGGALGIPFLTESLDQTFRTSEQVEATLGLPVLATFTRRKRRRQRVPASEPSSNGERRARSRRQPIGSYAALVRQLHAANGNGNGHAKTIGVVGCETSTLRSRVAAGLATEAASFGVDPVLLIDADSRRRRVAKRFRVNESPGWREVLAGAVDVGSCIHRQEAGNLAVMAPGGTNGHATATKPAKNVLGQLDEMRTEYGLIVVDLPPARELDAVPSAARWINQIVIVIEAERTRVQAAQRVKAMLERSGVQVLGVVLANRREHVPDWLYRRL